MPVSVFYRLNCAVLPRIPFQLRLFLFRQILLFILSNCTGLYKDAGEVPAITSSDMDEILIGSHSCNQLNDLLKLQVSRLHGKASQAIAAQSCFCSTISSNLVLTEFLEHTQIDSCHALPLTWSQMLFHPLLQS